MDQSFTERSFWRVLRKGDAKKYGLGKTRNDIRESLKSIEQDGSRVDFEFSRFNIQKRQKSNVYSTNNRTDEFILRKLADNLTRALNIKYSDRHEILPQVIQIAKETRNSSIYKFDLKSFFESIDRKSLIEKLSLEHNLSKQNLDYIRRLFQSPMLASENGLPRGLAISSPLAEYYLSELETKLRQLNYCHFYVRYVDDMIFFCHGDSSSIREDITSNLPTGINLNDLKSSVITIDNSGIADKSKSIALSYLGYKIIFPTNKNESFRVSMPFQKINKIKTRISLSFVKYTKENNYTRLKLRLRFLTSNFKIGGSKKIGILYSGIHYNHKYLDEESATATFKELDEYLQKLTYSKKGSIGKKLFPMLSNQQRKELCGYSFLNGYKDPIYRNIDFRDMALITEVWDYV